MAERRHRHCLRPRRRQGEYVVTGAAKRSPRATSILMRHPASGEGSIARAIEPIWAGAQGAGSRRPIWR